MTALAQLLNTFRTAAQTEREKGTYFERLVKTYLQQEPSYQDLFGGQVYLWEEWRKQCLQQGQPDPGVDTGIDLVAVEATKYTRYDPDWYKRNPLRRGLLARLREVFLRRP